MNRPSRREKHLTWRFLKTPAIIRPLRQPLRMLAHLDFGEVTELPIVLVSKISVPARVPRVRIPLSPLYQTQSGSRNRPQTPEFDEGCGCRRLGAVPRLCERSSHQSSCFLTRIYG